MKISLTLPHNCAQKLVTLLLLILIPNQLIVFAIPSQNGTSALSPAFVDELTNKHIVEMVTSGLSAEIVVAKIKNSQCKFDTSPSKIAELKRFGIPEIVILAMIQAPQTSTPPTPFVGGPPPSNTETGKEAISPKSLRPGEILIPDGTPIEVELTYTVSSDEVQEGSTMSFKAIRPVKVNGATVIESGASAAARVKKAKGGGSWGKSGKLEWAMQGIAGVDGSNIPLEFERKTSGKGKGGQVATGIVVTTLLGFGVLSLLWGFKNGKSAKIPAGTRFEVFTYGDAIVQSDKSLAELKSLSSGVLDLNGNWTYGGQVVIVSQNGPVVSVKYIAGEANCNGTNVGYVFEGSIQGNQLIGKMPVCSQPDHVKNCSLPPFTDVPFTAEISYGKISGLAFIPFMSAMPSPNGSCSVLRNDRQVQDLPFQISRLLVAD